MPKDYNKTLIEVLHLTDNMLLLADRGDKVRIDRTCGIIYGILRDTSYKLRSLVDNEIILHKQQGYLSSDDLDSVNSDQL